MTITLIICIPITALVVGFLVLKSVQLGLKWQMQVAQQKPPDLTIPNPIQPIVEAKKEKEVKAEQANIINEWLNGIPDESR